MDNKYLTLLSQKFPAIDSVISEIVNLSAIRSLPKGTEYFTPTDENLSDKDRERRLNNWLMDLGW